MYFSMGVKLLNFSEDDLYLISNKVLDIAKKNGATASEVEISVSSGKTISTRWISKTLRISIK